METLPKITEKYLKSISSANSFSKGLAYYNHKAVKNSVRDGMVLRAEVEGSEYQPYRVSISFDEGEIDDADCTCPFDYGGYCKHQIAVLLKYIHEPESFIVQTPLAELLARRSREELILLIERMVEREPDLRDMLEMPIAGKDSRVNPVNVEGYRRELQRHISNYDEYQLIRSIRSIVRNARDFARAKDYANAIRIYGCILEETVLDADFEFWGEGDVLEPLNDILVALEDCMKAVRDETELRRSILTYWLKATAWDLQIGGIGFADEAEDWVRTYAKAEDIPLLRPILEKVSRGWASEYVENFLEELDLIEGKDPEASIQRILDKGLYSPYFDKMLDSKRLDEALSVWQHFNPQERITKILYLAGEGYRELAIQYAEDEVHKHKNYQNMQWLLAQYESQGQDEKAITLAKSLLNRKEGEWLYTWLIEHYERRKNPEMILEWNQKRFKALPKLEHYSALMKAAKTLGKWEDLEAETLKLIEKNHALMTKIHMLEKRWQAAWDSLELALKAASQQRYSYYSEVSGLDLDLAETAQEFTPDKSIQVYIKYARQHIDYRQRSSYAEAAQYLKNVQRLYLKTLNDPDSWKKLIEGLRNEFKNLPAMQDEFRKAGLYK
jgi:uncharacterized Zn finger protein